MKFRPILLLFALLACGSATAQDEKTAADLRCLVAVSQSAGAIEKLMPGSSAIAMFYFLGKLDGRDPDLKLEDALVDMSSKMTPTDISQEDIRCGQELSQRGKDLKDIGAHMIERASKPPLPPAPDHSL